MPFLLIALRLLPSQQPIHHNLVLRPGEHVNRLQQRDRELHRQTIQAITAWILLGVVQLVAQVGGVVGAQCGIASARRIVSMIQAIPLLVPLDEMDGVLPGKLKYSGDSEL